MNQSMSRTSLTLLPKKNKKALQLISKSFGPRIRLSGGTALMLQIKHRISYDLDFFFNKELSVAHLEKKMLSTLGTSLKLLYASSDQMNFEWSGVRVILVYFPFPPLWKLLQIGDARVTNIMDIASEKAYSIGRREEWRDYIDLFSILKIGNIKIEQIIKDCGKRFGDGFSTRLFLNQLSTVDEVQPYAIDWLGEEVLPNDIFVFFKKVVKDYMKGLRG